MIRERVFLAAAQAARLARCERKTGNPSRLSLLPFLCALLSAIVFQLNTCPNFPRGKRGEGKSRCWNRNPELARSNAEFGVMSSSFASVRHCPHGIYDVLNTVPTVFFSLVHEITSRGYNVTLTALATL
ncbi:hypothetical protein Salat_1892800 [Sesamum alatum]|uniref:Uncharacterized protein n=1 Tax=Sesamum alatum TaxID=300844 RepID=A0AAE1Y4E3_9LAMI|nr:hypothetical protein Salat_1892800 [Sesamum alatum]